MDNFSTTEVPCREPAIGEFPDDLFTKEQLQSGWIGIHMLVTLYLFYALAIVCDDYFVPSVEVMAKVLKIPSEVAGCTILGISNSSPELFTNIIATFIAQGDLGISSIVGASVFNLLAVAASIGIISKKGGILIEWWPLARDSAFYLIAVLTLVYILIDNLVEWYDGAALLLLYMIYILIIIFNRRIHRWVKNLVKRCGSLCRNPKAHDIEKCEPTTVSTTTSMASILNKSEQAELDVDPSNIEPIPDEFEEETMPLCTPPYGESWFVWSKFIVGWPIRLAYKLTIPDCKIANTRKYFAITLVMCVAWNTVLCYLLGWMVTVIGWTFGIPDTVMGLTLFAMGTSVPQAMSSIIVARRGMGTMAMNNAIGSNIFNILVCLGLPWLIQTLILVGDSSVSERYIVVNSQALSYTALMLVACTIGLFAMISLNKFVINRTVGIIALISYFVVLAIASLVELNVFVQINLPMCDS